MSRVQLALNVDDLDAAIGFYSTLLATEPRKVKPGYANYAIENPPLKLVLIENPGHGGSLNHLGVEVASTAEVTATRKRLSAEGLPTTAEDHVTCCYAVQDKVWVDDPSGAPWEIYTVLSDTDTPEGAPSIGDPACGPGRCDTAPAASSAAPARSASAWLWSSSPR